MPVATGVPPQKRQEDAQMIDTASTKEESKREESRYSALL
jgi:hypothetical protein